MAILEVNDLCVYYQTRQGKVRALDGITFSIEQGESLGLVGESGCGKTTAGKALLRLLADNAAIVRGQMLYKGTDLVTLSPAEMRSVRGREIAMIPQSAMNALDPVTRIDALIREGMQAHREIAAEASRERVVELFASVGLEANRIDDYPHMFSGGMRQRAVIAAIFALRPSLIIADEPTTALDVIVQDQVLKQLADLVRETGATLIAITHDIGIVAENCRKTGVMYAGKLVEIGPTDKVLIAPCHPYTMGLQNGLLGVRDERREIISIPGVPPNLINPPAGCRFHPRCPFAKERCAAEEPPLEEISPGHRCACHFFPDAEAMRLEAKKMSVWIKECEA
jgi:oligopeptide/dipeptide ABC transporter ATP-binding protein